MTQAAVASPCVSVCVMDEPSGWCTGCLRTLDEIAVWSLLDDAEKRGVWLQLSQRRMQWRRLQASQPAQTNGAESGEP
jgi:uncharacterized protein